MGGWETNEILNPMNVLWGEDRENGDYKSKGLDPNVTPLRS